MVFNAPGTAGRDVLRGPGSSNIDLALFKNFALGERFRLEARVQAYNLTNTPHFDRPGGTNGTTLGNADFGQVTTALSDQRQISFGLKILF